MIALRKSNAFTMVEMMVVLFIIGILAALVLPRVMEYMSKGRKTGTEAMMVNVKGALADYSMDLGHIPSSREGGLDALKENTTNSPKWKGPYFTQDLDDKWGNPFVYNRPPQITGKKFKYYELISYGEGGEGSPEEEWIVQGE